MPPFCSHCVAQFLSTKGAFCLPIPIVWQAASFTKVAEDQGDKNWVSPVYRACFSPIVLLR